MSDLVQFTDRAYDATAGTYRDECGRLAPCGAEYVQPVTGADSVSPRYTEPDHSLKLPSMQDIFEMNRLRSIVPRPETSMEPLVYDEPWTFDLALCEVNDG